jgi:hypothetical protein
MKTAGVGIDTLDHPRSLKANVCRVSLARIRQVMITRELCLAVLALVLIAIGLTYLARSSPEFHRVVNERDRPPFDRARLLMDRQAQDG